jgi:hypothetical protein
VTEKRTVAILNTSDDTVEILTHVLERAGFETVSAFIRDIRRGELDLAAFIDQHDPTVILYDLAPPLRPGVGHAAEIKERRECGRCNFVLTTTNAREVEKIVGRDQQVFEIIGPGPRRDDASSAASCSPGPHRQNIARESRGVQAARQLASRPRLYGTPSPTQTTRPPPPVSHSTRAIRL